MQHLEGKPITGPTPLPAALERAIEVLGALAEARAGPLPAAVPWPPSFPPPRIVSSAGEPAALPGSAPWPRQARGWAPAAGGEATRVLTLPPQCSLPETQVFGRFAVGAKELIVPLETRESSIFVLEEASRPGATK